MNSGILPASVRGRARALLAGEALRGADTAPLSPAAVSPETEDAVRAAADARQTAAAAAVAACLALPQHTVDDAADMVELRQRLVSDRCAAVRCPVSHHIVVACDTLVAAKKDLCCCVCLDHIPTLLFRVR
jgi:hypothetical protein